MIIARFDVILDQSERALLYIHLSNYTNMRYSNLKVRSTQPYGASFHLKSRKVVPSRRVIVQFNGLPSVSVVGVLKSENPLHKGGV